ncbi:hypothetical protein MMC11_002572 [Xylographa trunciseda]|nr:hypothetical protein [Xylographa trunciseda]
MTNYYETLFNTYVAPLNEFEKVRQIRQYGNLVIFQFQFDPKHVHDQGIRIDDVDIDIPTKITHQYFRAMFNQRFDLPVLVSAFVQIPGGDFSGLAQEPQIQKGLITERHLRPTPQLKYVHSYRDMEHWITCVGFGIQTAEENTALQIARLEHFEVELRLIKTNMGGDMAYCCLLRCPNEFPVRIQENDHFMVYLAGDKKPWTAHTLSTPLPFGSTTDLTMTLSRPRNDEGDGWSTLKLPYFDVSGMTKEKDHRGIVDFCYYGEPVKARVKLVHSNKPTKLILAGIKKMNPFVTRKDGTPKVNDTWHNILLGKDLQRRHTIDVFGGTFDIVQRIEQLCLPQLNKEQLAFVESLRKTPNGFLLLRGPPGTGNIQVDVSVILIAISQGKKVVVVSSSNDGAHSNIHDRRYQLHEIFLGTVILKSTGLHQRSPPPHAATTKANDLLTAVSLPAGATVDSIDAVPLPAGADIINVDEETDHTDAESEHQSDNESVDSYSSVPRPKMSKAEMALHKKDNMSKVQAMIHQLGLKSQQAGFKRKFIEYFREKEMGVELDSEANTAFTFLYNELRNAMLRENVDVLVTTLVNAGDQSIVDNFSANLGIIQEGSKTGAEAIVALGNYQCPFYTSGDEEQLGVETEDNIFAEQINTSSFQRLAELNAPQHMLYIQYRMIQPIDDLVSTIYYQGRKPSLDYRCKEHLPDPIAAFGPQVTSDPTEDIISSWSSLPNAASSITAHEQAISLFDRPNVPWIAAVLKAKYDHEGTPVMFDVPSVAEKVGVTRTKRNNMEVATSIRLIEDLVAGGIPIAEITILIPYNAQVVLITKQLALHYGLFTYIDLSTVQVDTLDVMHREKNSVVILTIISTEILMKKIDCT